MQRPASPLPRIRARARRRSVAAPLAAALSIAGALVGACATPQPAPRAPQLLPAPDTHELHGAPIELHTRAEYAEIAKLEDARDTSGRLQELLEHTDAGVRARACAALGRCARLEGSPTPNPPIGAALCAHLSDLDPSVRAAAAFALGLRAEPGTGALIASCIPAESSALARARLVEAASRFPDEATRAPVVAMLGDPDADVRIEAALGIARWKSTDAGAEPADIALIAALADQRARALATDGSTAASTGNPRSEATRGETLDFEAAALFALSRRASSRGRTACLEHVRAPNPLSRIFAVKGLAALASDEEIGKALLQALDDVDWRVATEAATAVEAHPISGAEPALNRAIEHTSAHVRAAAAAALGFCSSDRDAAIRGLERALRDVSPTVRAAALIARTRIDVNEPWDELPTLQKAARMLSPVHTARNRLRESIDSTNPHMRAAVATAAGLLTPTEAIPLLAELANDPHPLPAGVAIEQLGKLGDDAARAIVRAALHVADDGVRLAAVQALGDTAAPSDVPLLERALELAHGDIEPEIAFNVALALGRIGGPSARELCTRIGTHREPWVRHVALQTLRERFAATDAELEALRARAPAESSTAATTSAATSNAVAAKDAAPSAYELPPAWTINPLVRIDTTRGSLVFELYAGECPFHVHSFLERVQSGFYDGTTFHRVVPDFVVQGGDRRGDGNGGSSWRGDALRNEFTSRKFQRGTLGMPRNDNPDSGGSQIFATHRATPHLDGRYTAFGDLRAGFDVLDRLEVGDQIVRIELLR